MTRMPNPGKTHHRKDFITIEQADALIAHVVQSQMAHVARLEIARYHHTMTWRGKLTAWWAKRRAK